MPREQKVVAKTAKQNGKTSKLRKLWVTLAIVIAVPLLLVGALEVSYQLRVNKLKAANEQIWRDAVQPAGGIADLSYVHGAHVWDICVDNGPCPEADSSWLMLVDAGSEKAVQQRVLDALKKDGYTTSAMYNMFGGTKGGINIDFAFYSLGDRDRQPPYPAPAGKSWKSLDANAYENPQ